VIPNLPHHDSVHVEAAIGWLGLGSWQEANEELNLITPILRAHPDVLRVRYALCAQAGQWELALEIAQTLALECHYGSWGFIHSGEALDKLKRTAEAYKVLDSVLQLFPEDSMLRYNLCRYCCKLGRLKEAMECLDRAIDLAGKKDIRQQALDDPDLEPLWVNISEI
jgi:tetratricopeptide (TPR) repeat protein